MQKKVVEIPFNKEFFLDSHNAIWSFSSGKRLEHNVFFTIVAIVTLTVNIIAEQSNKFPVGIILSGGFLVYMLLYWSGYFARKLKYFKKVKEQLHRYELASTENIYTFSDIGFEYKDQEKSFKFIWSLFKPAVIYKDNILLILKDTGLILALTKRELGDAVYEELCNILREKIGEI